MTTQSKDGGVREQPTTAFILCQLRSGQCLTTTAANCINNLGGMVVDDITIPTLSAELLILYTTPSGQEVVGTFDDCLADGGKLVEGFDSREKRPSDIESSELFICKLPSGKGIVATYAECETDGGTVIGKLRGRTR
jgi:hypothetical protein